MKKLKRRLKWLEEMKVKFQTSQYDNEIYDISEKIRKSKIIPERIETDILDDIRKYMSDKGLKQAEIAPRLHISESYLCSLLNGSYRLTGKMRQKLEQFNFNL